jgi:hypothetical protein
MSNKHKPADWPRYMIAKRLADGTAAYYWNPRKKDIERGFPIKREALGSDYGQARIRCDGDPKDPDNRGLNGFLDDWRANGGADKSLDLVPSYGTVDWWLERYYRTDAFLKKVSDRSKPDYRKALKRIADIPPAKSVPGVNRLGQLPAKSITPAAVDKLYVRLRGGEEGTKYRSANLATDVAKKAWRVVQRRYPDLFHPTNPFVGLERIRQVTETAPTSREEAYALAFALRKIGHPHLGAAPLICFEWLQRPENVLEGYIKWPDYRPPDHPTHVQIVHHKTGDIVWHPLEDAEGRFYPEIEDFLAELPMLGTPVVLTPGERGTARPYSFSYARRIVRLAREHAGLGNHVTLTACRHGGMTELGDAELTEQGVMALSAQASPEAARLYIKRNERQRRAAARKRRAWVEQERSVPESQNRRSLESQNKSGEAL